MGKEKNILSRNLAMSKQVERAQEMERVRLGVVQAPRMRLIDKVYKAQTKRYD